MNSERVTVVRIYLNEGEKQAQTLLKRLHDWEKVRGVTVFRGIVGFGPSGVLHGAGLVDLSLNLPVVVEFFDDPDKVAATLAHIQNEIKPAHIVWWEAQTNKKEG